jgi:hypothetical protein
MFVGEAIAAAVLWTTYALLVRHFVRRHCGRRGSLPPEGGRHSGGE